MNRSANTFSLISMILGIMTIVMAFQSMPTIILLPMAVLVPYFTGGLSILFGCLSRGSFRTFSTKAVIGVRMASITLAIYTVLVAFLAISHETNMEVRGIINSYISDTLTQSGVTEITIEEDDSLTDLYHKYFTTGE